MYKTRERKCMAGKGRCKGRQEEVKEMKLEEKMGKVSLKREEGQRIRWVQRERKGVWKNKRVISRKRTRRQ